MKKLVGWCNILLSWTAYLNSHSEYQVPGDHTLNAFTDTKPNSALIWMTSSSGQWTWKIAQPVGFTEMQIGHNTWAIFASVNLWALGVQSQSGNIERVNWWSCQLRL